MANTLTLALSPLSLAGRPYGEGVLACKRVPLRRQAAYCLKPRLHRLREREYPFNEIQRDCPVTSASLHPYGERYCHFTHAVHGSTGSQAIPPGIACRLTPFPASKSRRQDARAGKAYALRYEIVAPSSAGFSGPRLAFCATWNMQDRQGIFRRMSLGQGKISDHTTGLLPRYDHRHSPLQTHKIQRHAAKILDHLSLYIV